MQVGELAGASPNGRLMARCARGRGLERRRRAFYSAHCTTGELAPACTPPHIVLLCVGSHCVPLSAQHRLASVCILCAIVCAWQEAM